MLTTCLFVNIMLTFCPTYSAEVVNKEYIGVYNVSRYYSPMPGQKSYYLNRTYEADLAMNTSGDPLVTASGYRLTAQDAHRAVACPPNFKLGTRLFIEGIGNVTCHDRGGAIKGKRLDLWAGIGEQGLENVYRYARTYAGPKNIYLIK